MNIIYTFRNKSSKTQNVVVRIIDITENDVNINHTTGTLNAYICSGCSEKDGRIVETPKEAILWAQFPSTNIFSSKYLSDDDSLMECARIYEKNMGKWLTFDSKHRKCRVREHKPEPECWDIKT